MFFAFLRSGFNLDKMSQKFIDDMAKANDRIFVVHATGGIAYPNRVHGFVTTTCPGAPVPAEPIAEPIAEPPPRS